MIDTKYCSIFSLDEWERDVKNGYMIPYDGSAYYFDGINRIDDLDPFDILTDKDKIDPQWVVLFFGR